MERERRPRRSCAIKQIEKSRKEIAREELNKIHDIVLDDENQELDENSDDDFIESRPRVKAPQGVSEGKEMFNFASQSPSVKMNLLKRATKTPTRKSSKNQNTPNSTRTPSKREILRKEMFEATTPHATRSKIAGRLKLNKEEQMNDREISEEESDDDFEEDEPEDGLIDEEEPEEDSCGYFNENSRKNKTKTTDHTLSKLGGAMLTEEQIDKVIEQQKDPHAKHRKIILARLVESFDFWKHLTLDGSNLLLYGLGSKLNLLNKFADYLYEDSFIVMVINGFLPTYSLQEMISNILDQVIEKRPKGVIGLQPQIDFISSYFSDETAPHLYLIVNSFDANPITNPKTLQAFECLAAAPMIHIVGSVNHINAPLLWDLNRARAMKWAWIEATTYEPYKMELCSDSLKSSTANTLSSLEHVFASLTSNAKKVFMIIANYTLERSSSSGFCGMPFQDCYRLCRESFVVNSDLTLRTQLTEFVDHDMIRIRKGQDGVEYLVTPLKNETLQIFVQQQQANDVI